MTCRLRPSLLKATNVSHYRFIDPLRMRSLLG